MIFFRRNVFNLDNLYHFLFLLYQHFCSLQHKPVFLHTVFGLYFTWSIYLIRKIHKKIDSAQSNIWPFVNERIKMYHRIKFSTVDQLYPESCNTGWRCFTLYCFMKFVYFQSKFSVFIFVLAHLQKRLRKLSYTNLYVPTLVRLCKKENG